MIGIVENFTNITKLKQSEKALIEGNKKLDQALSELKTTQAQMLHSEKMASIGQLAAGVAHEINNPTGFISSNLNTLSDYLNDIKMLVTEYRKMINPLKDTITRENLPASLPEYIERISALEKKIDIDFLMDDTKDLIGETSNGARRIKKIVADLKDFAHPGEDKAKQANINENIESTLNVVWNELKYKAKVEKEYGDIPQIECYPQQLNQVFMNLLVNASQAIEKKGEIRVTTRTVNNNIEIEISDTGSGIPEKNLSQIFDPFFTTKEVGKGTGLGLNISHNIVRKHGGIINVESTVGKGTTFTIQLPVK